MKRVLDSIVVTVLVTAIAYAVFVAALWNARGRQISRFIVIGALNVDVHALPPNIATIAAYGYDGTGYYRLALDPFTRVRTAYGITLDAPAYRQQRIGYPLLVWLLSGGSAAAVPWLLVIVNVAAVTAIAATAAMFARLHGHAAAWGALAAFYPGFLYSVSRDLTEPLACAFAVAAFVAMQKQRDVAAGALLACAVLTRESFIVTVIAIGVVAALSRARWIVAVIPAGVYVAWQTILKLRWGVWPFLDGGPSLAPPLVAYAHTLLVPQPLWHGNRLPFTRCMSA